MKSKDLIGKKIGHWTVLCVSFIKDDGSVYLKCKCDCGKIKEVLYGNLVRQKTLSCGCETKKKARERMKTHGLSKTRLFDIWRAIKQRCYDKNKNNYKNYGGRGINVCDEWATDFKSFYDWSIENGYNDNLTIDRIDVNGNYEPLNCRWIIAKEQCRNKRNNRLIMFKGETHCLAEWEDILGFSRGTIANRLRRGLSEIEAITKEYIKRK